MINKITLIGNLGQDPDVKHLESGSTVARLTVATNESYKDKDGNWQKQTEWHTVIAWRDLAERAERNMKKGELVYIEGKITYRKYKDAAGVEKIAPEIVASTLRQLTPKELQLPGQTDHYAHLFPPDQGTRRAEPTKMETESPDDLPF